MCEMRSPISPTTSHGIYYSKPLSPTENASAPPPSYHSSLDPDLSFSSTSLSPIPTQRAMWHLLVNLSSIQNRYSS